MVSILLGKLVSESAAGCYCSMLCSFMTCPSRLLFYVLINIPSNGSHRYDDTQFCLSFSSSVSREALNWCFVSMIPCCMKVNKIWLNLAKMEDLLVESLASWGKLIGNSLGRWLVNY